MPNYAYLLGGMGAAALSNAYYPRGERGGGPIVTNAVLVLWVVLPGHPIAEGVSDFTIPQTEIYTEPFEVPQPEAVIVEGTWESGRIGKCSRQSPVASLQQKTNGWTARAIMARDVRWGT